MVSAGPPEPPSLEPLRRLVAEAIEKSLELPHDEDRGDWRHLWREGVRALVAIQGGWEGDAVEAVASLVNHVRRLSVCAEWFLTEPELRTLALEETIVHTAHGYEVTSQAAQDAWTPYWSATMNSPLPPESTDGPGEAEELADWLMLYTSLDVGPLEETWISAWNSWAERGGT